MTFKKETISIVRELAKKLTRAQIAKEMKMSLPTLYRILRENKDISPVAVKRGRPQTF